MSLTFLKDVMRSFFRFSSACVFLDARMSLQPLSKRQWARAFPIPEDAPVSTTTCRTDVHDKSRGFIIHLLSQTNQRKNAGYSGQVFTKFSIPINKVKIRGASDQDP